MSALFAFTIALLIQQTPESQTDEQKRSPAQAERETQQVCTRERVVGTNRLTRVCRSTEEQHADHEEAQRTLRRVEEQIRRRNAQRPTFSPR